MATPQTNLRLRDGLGRQLNVKAAELGIKPRDLVEEALIATYGFRRDASRPQEERLFSGEAPLDPREAPTTRAMTPPAASDSPPVVVAEGETRGCPECGSDLTADNTCAECGWRS